MTETTGQTELPAYLKRLTTEAEWWGCLTLENLDLVAERLRKLLDGRRYTFVASNEGLRQYFPEVRTGLALRDRGVTASRSTMDDGSILGHLNVSDSYGSWGMFTTVPDVTAAHALSYDEQRKQGTYLHIKYGKVEIEHFAPVGARLYWVATLEPPCDADVLDTGISTNRVYRAAARAQQCAHDAATAIYNCRESDARTLLAEAMENLDQVEARKAELW